MRETSNHRFPPKHSAQAGQIAEHQPPSGKGGSFGLERPPKLIATLFD